MHLTNTAYPLLRESLGPDYLEVSDEQLDFIVAEVYGEGVTAEDVESFWNDVGRGFQNVAKGVGRFAQKAAPVVGRALPSIAQGALTGASVGGPFGAIAGAVAGGAGGILSQSRNKTLRGIGGAIGGVGRLAANFTGGGALGGLANVALGALGRGGGPAGALGGIGQAALGALQSRGGAAGAVGQIAGAVGPQIAGALGGRGASANALIGLLSRPETVRALSSAALGQYGRPNVMVGMQPVPVQSVMNAVGTLAGRAAVEAEAASESLPPYFYGADGELAIDPSDAEQRVDALLELYAWTPPPGARPVAFELESESAEPEYTEAHAHYDAWLIANEAEWSGDQEDESYA